MSREKSRILALIAAGRIDIGHAEWLLFLAAERSRFLALPFWLSLLAATWNHLSLLHAAANLPAGLQAALESIAGSETIRHLHLFLNRFPGELP